MNSKPTGLFLLDDQYIDMIYSPAVRAEIESLAAMRTCLGRYNSDAPGS